MRRMGYFAIGTLVALWMAWISLPNRVFAINKDDFGFDDAGNLGLPKTENFVDDVVLGIVRWVLSLLGVAAVIMIIYGGYLWLTAGGEDKQVEDAKKAIRAAVTGLAIVLLSYAISILVFSVIDDAVKKVPPG